MKSFVYHLFGKAWPLVLPTFNAAGLIDMSFVSPNSPETEEKIFAVGRGMRRLKIEDKGKNQPNKLFFLARSLVVESYIMVESHQSILSGMERLQVNISSHVCCTESIKIGLIISVNMT